MNEIIPMINENPEGQDLYEEYETLLLQRDQYAKEAAIYRQLYIHELGDLITAVFEQKIVCIRYKKEIAFCQSQVNCGQTINMDEMKAFLQREMAAYQEELNRMIQENEASREIRSSSDYTVGKVKRIYHRLAKLIHPDINPETDASSTLRELWVRIVLAYHGNSLKAIQELEVLTHKYLSDNGLEDVKIEIEDLATKISGVRQEIYDILNTDPYLYKALLEDEDKLAEKRAALQDELQHYTDYGIELAETLDLLIQNGGISWRMN